MTEPTLHARARSCFAVFERWRPDLALALGGRHGPEATEALVAEVRGAFGELLKQMPDPGWRAPTMRAFSVAGALYLAVYQRLAAHGYDVAAAWEVCEAATRAYFARMSRAERWLAGPGMFSRPMRALVRGLAKRSRREPVGGWVVTYVPREEGRFDFGVDYTRCAIRDLAVRVGAGAFAPYICLADIVGSEVFGWGLVRSETLAQGGARCDFRFARGAETRVKVRLRVVPP